MSSSVVSQVFDSQQITVIKRDFWGSEKTHFAHDKVIRLKPSTCQ